MTCPGCGSAVQADFAFCPRCGGKLDGRPPLAERRVAAVLRGSSRPPEPEQAGDRQEEGDRRLVTVLFADLAGFTALAEALDPEEVRALQSDLFRELSGAIERYDGFVEKFVGDAVMAVFGAPARARGRSRARAPRRAPHARARRRAERAMGAARRPAARPPRRGEHRPRGGRHHRRRVRGRLRRDRRHRQHRVAAPERRRGRRDPREPVHAPADRARLPPGSGGRDRDEGEEPAARRLPARGGARDPALRARARGAGARAPMVGRAAELGQMVAAFDEMLRAGRRW